MIAKVQHLGLPEWMPKKYFSLSLHIYEGNIVSDNPGIIFIVDGQETNIITFGNKKML
jgi:hypothetical protein